VQTLRKEKYLVNQGEFSQQKSEVQPLRSPVDFLGIAKASE